MAKKFTYNGKTYDSDKAYRDKNGDTWTFTGQREHMTDGSGPENDAPLAWVVDICGPLDQR